MPATRRQLFAYTTFGLPVILSGTLAGCNLVQKATDDAHIIANGVRAVLPTIQSVLGIGSAAYAKVQGIIAGIEAAAATVGTEARAITSDAASKIAAGAAALKQAVSGFQIPAWVTSVVDAAVKLAPSVLSLAGIVLAGPQVPPQEIVQARAILIAATSA